MKNLLPICAALLLVGCEAVPHYDRVSVLNLQGLPTQAKVPKDQRKPYGSVKLFESQEAVGQKYDVVALMSVEGSAGDEARFLTAFLYRGADLGADGVIVYRMSIAGGSEGGMALFGPRGGFAMPASTSQNAFYRAEAIKFK